MIFFIFHEYVISSFHTKILDLLGRKLLLLFLKQLTIFMLLSKAYILRHFYFKITERKLVQNWCRVYPAGL